MLKLKKVTKVFRGNIVVLDHLTFDVRKGELVYLVGPNRSGKTTLLRLVAAQAKPTRGEIIFDGMSNHDMQPKGITVWRRKLGLVFEDPGLVDDMSVYDNVALGLRVLGQKESRVKPKVGRVLQQVGLAGKSRIPAGRLSFAERQRTSIARAMAKNPVLLLADEPASGLDRTSSGEIMDLLKRMNVFGTTMLLTLREPPADGGSPGRVIRIERGSVVDEDPLLVSRV